MWVEACDYRGSSDRIRIEVEDGRIGRIEPMRTSGSDDELRVAPAFCDIQFNGRWGVSFSDPTLTVEQVVEIVLEQAKLGSARVFPTLITASREATLHGLRTIAQAVEQDQTVGALFGGIHLEGPWISSLDGYRGAHPLSAVRDPDMDEFATWQEASGGRIALVTLAPERLGAIEAIEALVRSGVVVAIGHTSADGSTLKRAADAGATLSTHLGNGIAATLPRHPNAIWQQAADDRLFASFIADGHHLDDDTLSVLLRVKGLNQSILVSDASPLAGLPVGRYGDWEVDPSGKIVVAGTPYLAGSNQPLAVGLSRLLNLAGASRKPPLDRSNLENAIDTVTKNPARLMRRPISTLATGEAADLVFFLDKGDGPDRIKVVATLIGGRWFDAPGSLGRRPKTTAD